MWGWSPPDTQRTRTALLAPLAQCQKRGLTVRHSPWEPRALCPWHSFPREAQKCHSWDHNCSNCPILVPAALMFLRISRISSQAKPICEVYFISKGINCTANYAPNSFKQKQACLKLKITTPPFPVRHLRLEARPELFHDCFTNRHSLTHLGTTSSRMQAALHHVLCKKTMLPNGNATVRSFVWFT